MLNTFIKNWQNNIFANSWIINTDNSDSALSILLKFCNKILNHHDDAVLHQDLILVKRRSMNGNSNDKFITVDQIRDMMFFLNKTPIKSAIKIAVIYEAEYMNINSANCCLKILEDPPINRYIFLITTKFASILSTIKSRCHLLTQKFDHCNNTALAAYSEVEYQNLINMLNAQTTKIQLEFIQKIKSIQLNSQEWYKFGQACMILIVKSIRYKVGFKEAKDHSNNDCAIAEMRVIEKISNTNSTEELVQKYDKVSNILYNTSNVDLDVGNATLLILSLMQNQLNFHENNN